jgi:hypothetical protein
MNLQVRFEMPEHGWMIVEIIHDEQEARFSASYIHPSSLDELIAALVLMLSDNKKALMYWELEPNQIWFEFSTANKQTIFEIKMFASDKRAFDTQLIVTLNTLELCTIFWRALRNLQSNPDLFSVGWRNPFPDAAMNLFTEQLESARKDTKL